MALIRFKKKRRPKRWRLLREYHRIAQKWYHCDKCEIPIFEGMEYIGRVRVLGRWLHVERTHTICPYDPREDEEKERKKQDQSLSSAA